MPSSGFVYGQLLEDYITFTDTVCLPKNGQAYRYEMNYFNPNIDSAIRYSARRYQGYKLNFRLRLCDYQIGKSTGFNTSWSICFSECGVDMVCRPGKRYNGEDEEWILFPNPVNDKIKIRFENFSMEAYELRFFNLIGNEVISYTVEGYDQEIDISGLSPALYIVTLQDQNKKVIGYRKIIKH